MYDAHTSQRGPDKHGDINCSIGVPESSDNHMPIGMANCQTWDENGAAVRSINPVLPTSSGQMQASSSEFEIRH
jgi:hypothetical protein